MRRKLLFGNWKMNKTREEAKAFARESVELLALAKAHDIDIGVAPTFLSLCPVHKENPELTIAAQNCHFEDHGAFTGEISVTMLLDLGVTWCLVGHSERRTYFAETNESCNKKLKVLVANKMTPIYCVGETLAEFEDCRAAEGPRTTRSMPGTWPRWHGCCANTPTSPWTSRG
ncbi:MAG: triose-phosphate isomerase [Bacteroidales bacterium]|nr:triose-phosphate isomerase [Bacteroidales bacterium]